MSAASIHPKAQKVLNFWLGDGWQSAGPAQINPEMMKVWFRGGAEVDQAIRTQFGEDCEALLKGEYASWKESEHVHETLAGIILADQFFRNAFRDTAKMYAADGVGLSWGKSLVSRGDDKKLVPLHRMWVFLPFMHSESLADQEECVRLFTELHGEVESLEGAEELAKLTSFSLQYAHSHKNMQHPQRNPDRLWGPDDLEEGEYPMKLWGGWHVNWGSGGWRCSYTKVNNRKESWSSPPDDTDFAVKSMEWVHYVYTGELIYEYTDEEKDEVIASIYQRFLPHHTVGDPLLPADRRDALERMEAAVEERNNYFRGSMQFSAFLNELNEQQWPPTLKTPAEYKGAALTAASRPARVVPIYTGKECEIPEEWRYKACTTDELKAWWEPLKDFLTTIPFGSSHKYNGPQSGFFFPGVLKSSMTPSNMAVQEVTLKLLRECRNISRRDAAFVAGSVSAHMEGNYPVAAHDYWNVLVKLLDAENPPYILLCGRRLTTVKLATLCDHVVHGLDRAQATEALLGLFVVLLRDICLACYAGISLDIGDYNTRFVFYEYIPLGCGIYVIYVGGNVRLGDQMCLGNDKADLSRALYLHFALIALRRRRADRADFVDW